MSQKDDILRLLSENNTMTQGELASAMYGDNEHETNIYSALIALVNSGTVVRTNSRPFNYSLSDRNIPVGETVLVEHDINSVDSKNVILLNKPFLGGWLNKKGNIGLGFCANFSLFKGGVTKTLRKGECRIW